MRLLTFSFLKKCKLKSYYQLPRRLLSDAVVLDEEPEKIIGDPDLVEICPSWPVDEEPELRLSVLRDMQVIPNFVSEEEEASLLAEVDPYLKKMRYEFDHWDNAIQGYRETERSSWSAESAAVLSRARRVALSRGALPHAHVLDLAPAGFIKPHVDATRFCGDVIAGLCLLSSAVMRLEHSQHQHLALHALLAQRSLYIMRHVARYQFTHAVLGPGDSEWRGARVPRARRIAVICRAPPATSATR